MSDKGYRDTWVRVGQLPYFSDEERQEYDKHAQGDYRATPINMGEAYVRRWLREGNPPRHSCSVFVGHIPRDKETHTKRVRLGCEKCKGFGGYLGFFVIREYVPGKPFLVTSPNFWFDGDQLCPVLGYYRFYDTAPGIPFSEIGGPGHKFDEQALKVARTRGTLRGKYQVTCPACLSKLEASTEKLAPILLKVAENGIKRISIQALNRRLSRRPRKFED